MPERAQTPSSEGRPRLSMDCLLHVVADESVAIARSIKHYSDGRIDQPSSDKLRQCQ